jgi:hypothetical protein
VALGPCIRKHKAGEEVGGQNPETKPLWLDSWPAVSNSEGEWWRVVVVRIAQSGGSRNHRVHKRERGEGVEGRKPETKPLWLGSGSAVSNGDGG